MREDLKQQCLWIVKGHEERVKRYHEKRNAVLYASSSPNGMPGSNLPGNPTNRKMMQLEMIEQHPETKRVHAVEQAINCIGNDVSDEIKRKLMQSVMLNCISGREYTYERLALDGISRRDFYRRKEKFLMHIAEYLQLE